MKMRKIITTTVLILVLITISTTAAAALSCDCGDICVNQSGWWRDGGAFNASTTPIQAAVNAAGSGDTICVAAGGYTENVDIATSHLTLVGKGADVVTVTAASSSDHVFYVTADYVNISGFTATGATSYPYAGIYLDSTDHCNISDNAASNNKRGICLLSSSNNTLLNNTANSNNYDGIYLYSSSNNTLTGNAANSNNYDGIYLYSSSNNTLTGNTASDNYGGIYLYRSSDNTLLKNTANSNGEYGIFLETSSDNTLTENVASSNDYGIYLSYSSNNMLTGNTASNNRHGIYLMYSNNYNTLTENVASSNDYGIYLYSSNNHNTLTGNTANSNNRHGIYLYNSNNHNILTDNTASLNYYGIGMSGSSINTLTGNTASSNDDYGIRLGYSSKNTLTGNTASSNGGDGIHLYDSSNHNTLTGNTVSNNEWDLYIIDSDSTFTNNTLNGTNVSFAYGGDISLKGVGSPAADPAGQYTIGKFINATNQGTGAWLFLNFSYSDADVSGPDEFNLAVRKHNGTAWLKDGWNGTRYLDIAGNVVGANITSFSVFAPAAAPPPSLCNCTCGDICVNTSGWWRDGGAFNASGASIQAAVDNANAGDTIYVKAGSYNENVGIGTSHLTLAGESADVVNVTAADSNDHVFDVTADYVNISGFNATGATGSGMVGVYLNSTDHCNISDNAASGNDRGICLLSSSNNTLAGNTAISNNYGICLLSSSNNTLTGNTADSNNNYGICLLSSSNNTLTGNTAISNNYGICLLSSSNNTLTGNTADSNNNYGICLYSSSNNTLTGNTAISNNYGIFLYSSSNNTLIENTASSNVYSGIRLYLASKNNTLIGNNASSNNYHGIWLDDYSSENTLTGNAASSNVHSGIHLSVYSGKNTLTSNTARSNGGSGIHLDYSSNNLIYNNYFNNTLWDIYIVSSDSSFTNNTLNGTNVSFAYGGDISLKGVGSPAADPAGQYTIGKFINATNQGTGAWLFLNFSYSDADVSGPDEFNLAVRKHNGTAWLKDGWNGTRYLDTAGNVVGANITSFSVFAPAAAPPPSTCNCTCGDICVNQSGWWRDGGAFNASTTPIQAAVNAAGSGDTICVAAGGYTENVDIATSHLTLVGKGADVVTVTAASSSDHVFYVTADYVNISGFTATGATSYPYAGIYLDSTDHCNISDNAASNNKRGIYLYSSSNNTLTGNTANSNNYDGIYLYSSSNNTLTGNTANSNNYDGIYLYSSSNNTLTGNTASDNYDGIYLYRSSDSTLLNNTANSNGEYGIFLETSSDNTLTENVASSNDYGIYLSYSSNNMLTGNTASNNRHGIYLMYSNNHNTLTENVASSNDYGIYLYSSNNHNTLTGNTANSNNRHGIYLYNSNNHNILTDNTASLNYYGIGMSGSSINTLTGNTASSNDDYGIRLGYSSKNTLTGNTASSNGGDGIRLYDSSNYNTLTGNTVSNNEWDLYIIDSDSTFTNNTLNGTNVSFAYGGDISLKGVGSPAADPAGQYTIGKFINATNQGTGAWLFLNFSYSDADVSGPDEFNLAVWKHNGTAWLKDGWNGTRYLDTAGNVVGANITSFSVFAPVAAPPPSPCNCTCGDICVNTSGWWRDGGAFNASGASIQTAVNNAAEGETIYVWNGSYTENVNIGTSHLTLAGESADVVNVTAADSNDHVFDVTADYVNISGFNATGATGAGNAGIYLTSSQHCNISHNNAAGNYLGIGMYQSSNNTLTDNTASDNSWDLRIHSSASTFTNNTLKGTTVSFTYSGDITLKGVGSPAADPSGRHNISKFIDATNLTADAWLYLNFSYSTADVSGPDESSLKVWKYNGTAWLEDNWNGTRYLDEGTNTVGVNITTFSVFAPMATATPPETFTP